jgi:hypothetical protein
LILHLKNKYALTKLANTTPKTMTAIVSALVAEAEA